MIQTADYDIFVQLHEKMLNKALAMVFYAGKLNLPETEFNLVENQKVSEEFAPFSNFKFEVTLQNEPFIDLKGTDNIFIRCASQLKLNIFNCVDIYFTLDFNIEAEVRFNVDELKFEFVLNHVKILNIGAEHKYYVSSSFIGQLNHIVYDVLDTYYRNKVKTIDLNTLAPMQIAELKSKIAFVKHCDVKIFDDKSIIAGISFFGTNGNLAKVKNCLDKADCYVAVSENAAKNILDYWWNGNSSSLKVDFNRTACINFASGGIAKTTDTLMRVITLGFIQTETQYDNMTLNCSGSISLGGIPTLNFREDGVIEILNLDFVADVHFKIDADQTQSVMFDKSSFIPDSVTKFEDDSHLSTKTEHKTILDVSNVFTVKVEKAGAILKFRSRPNDDNLIDMSTENLPQNGIVDGSNFPNDGSVVAKVTDVEFKVEFDQKGSTFPDSTWAKLMDLVKGYIVDKIPELTVSPALILDGVKVLDKYTMVLRNAKLEVANGGFAFSTDVNIEELMANEVGIPNYIVDKDSNVVHAFECEDVYKIRQGKRVGYYVMYEALMAGFKPCVKCLKGYSLEN